MTGRRAATATPADIGTWTVVLREAVASTMDEARALAIQGAVDRTVVRAREQTGGRGRLGRAWTSPAGNVYTTAILRPPLPTARAAELSLVAAVAVADSVAAFGGPVRLKWPNDVLLDGGKVSGVLLEAMSDGTALSAVLIGIGINVASCPVIPDRPTARVPGADADTVFEVLLDRLDDRYAQWLRDGFVAIRSAWLERGPEPGKPMTVGQGGTTLDGRFAGLDPDGALRLTLADGTVRRIPAGEIIG